MAEIRDLEVVKEILFNQSNFVLWGEKDLIADALSVIKTNLNSDDLHDGKNYVYLKIIDGGFGSSGDSLRVREIFKSSKDIRKVAKHYEDDPEHYYDQYRYYDDYALEAPRIKVDNLFHNNHSSEILETLKSIEKKLDKLMLIPNESMTKSKGSSPKSFIAISPSGERTEERNITKFARENDLNKKSISACIHNNQKTHKGWRFEKGD